MPETIKMLSQLADFKISRWECGQDGFIVYTTCGQTWHVVQDGGNIVTERRGEI